MEEILDLLYASTLVRSAAQDVDTIGNARYGHIGRLQHVSEHYDTQ